VGIAALMSICPAAGATTSEVPAPAIRVAPVTPRVVDGRFVSVVELDGGAFTVRPSPGRLRPTSDASKIETQVWATGQIMGYRPQAFGFGLVTIRARRAGIPRVRDLPAWVALATDAGTHFSCPMMRVSPGRSLAPPEPALASPGEAAVIIGSATRAPALVYEARSDPCGTVIPATLTEALERLSIPWTAAGPVTDHVLPVRAILPECGSLAGIASGGSATAMTVTLYAVVPEAPSARSCAPAHVIDEAVVLGPVGDPGAPPPLVGPDTQILHGTTGPVPVVASSSWNHQSTLSARSGDGDARPSGWEQVADQMTSEPDVVVLGPAATGQPLGSALGSCALDPAKDPVTVVVAGAKLKFIVGDVTALYAPV
jgi:hypothetical protein